MAVLTNSDPQVVVSGGIYYLGRFLQDAQAIVSDAFRMVGQWYGTSGQHHVGITYHLNLNKRGGGEGGEREGKGGRMGGRKFRGESSQRHCNSTHNT